MDTTPTRVRMQKTMTAKRFLRSILIDGVVFGGILYLTLLNLLTGNIFMGLIDLALLVLLGYFGYRNYQNSVAVLNVMGFSQTWTAMVEVLEEDNKKEKSDGDTAI